MIGQTIEYRPSVPIAVFVWLLLAASLEGLSVAQGSIHPALFSLLPLLVAVLLWRSLPRSFTARFTETGLEVEEPPQQVPYASLQSLLAPRRPANPFKAGPASYLIQVIHSDGVLSIPARLNVPSDDVFVFLFRQLSPSGSREVPPTLADFLRRKEREFGLERVWTFRTRPYFGRNKQYPSWLAFFVALTLTASVWLTWGIVHAQEGWIAGGVVGLIFGILFSVILWVAGRQSLTGSRLFRQAGLVIAPDGLALAQGNMVGQLRWDEVRDVKIGKNAAAFQATTSAQWTAGIIIKVDGAVIGIADIYDRPIVLIHQHICYYWRGERGGEEERRSSWTGSGRSPDSEALSPPSSEGIAPRD